ncbi:hypothetical protein CPT_Moabite_306 [Serratia phage Moabite]|uniref:Uncharacterized protein n=1 Tax=Serratia phage Moabite TaxID=2587814 RepID=A0A4Y5TPQ5_9CAUD|nr:hypothetical protein HWC48_gp110 [Serratia phage Moabite]QDB71336.1 hypothetical protein CPT_Moabite_306 [Serratia phage Moabite]
MHILILLVLWVIGSYVVANRAQSNGGNFKTWFWISMIFDPLGGYVIYKLLLRK